MDTLGLAIRLGRNVAPYRAARLKWIREGRHASLVPRLMAALISEGDVVLDVGASDGGFSAAFSAIVGKKGVVHAFEPNPNSLLQLRAVARRRRNIIVHPVALSDNTASQTLSVPLIGERAIVGMGTLETRPTWAERPHEQFTIATATLDSLTEINRADFVKCDVEGHEEKVFGGAAQFFNKNRPRILIEIEQRHRSSSVVSTFSHLAELGYVGYALAEDRLYPLEDFDLARDQLSFADAYGSEIMPSGYVHNFLFVQDPAEVAGIVTAPPRLGL